MTTTTIQDPDQDLANWGLGIFLAGIIVPFIMVIGWIMSIVAWRKSVNRGFKNTKALIVTYVGAVIFAIGALFLIGAATADAAGPSYEDRPWTSSMNQTDYWAPWECTKYESHGGWIGAQYDAAIIKDGSKVVRVYANLEDVGGFQATHPQKPNGGRFSWVMKCTFPEQPPVTTVPETTVPETTEPETTEPEVTVPEETIPEETVPTEPNPTTPVPDTTPTPETPETGTQPPISPTTPDTPPALAETGATTGIIAAIAALLVLTGIGLLFTRKGI